MQSGVTNGAVEDNFPLPLGYTQEGAAAALEVAVGFSVAPLVFLQEKEAADSAREFLIDGKLSPPLGNVAGKGAEKRPEKQEHIYDEEGQAPEKHR